MTGRGARDGTAHGCVLWIYIWKGGYEMDMSMVVVTCFW